MLPLVELDEPQHGATGRRLAAAGFADQRERFAGSEIEVDLLDRMHAARDAAGEGRRECRTAS